MREQKLHSRVMMNTMQSISTFLNNVSVDSIFLGLFYRMFWGFYFQRQVQRVKQIQTEATGWPINSVK